MQKAILYAHCTLLCSPTPIINQRVFKTQAGCGECSQLHQARHSSMPVLVTWAPDVLISLNYCWQVTVILWGNSWPQYSVSHPFVMLNAQSNLTVYKAHFRSKQAVVRCLEPCSLCWDDESQAFGGQSQKPQHDAVGQYVHRSIDRCY